MSHSNSPTHAEEGMIILLNGASSSGKTSIAKALQDLLDPVYLHLELDTFIDMFPDDYDDIEDKNARTMRRNNVLLAMNACLCALVQAGYNLIIDHVLDEPQSMSNIINQLSCFKVALIAIHCSLEILEEREAARGDRKIGLAKTQYQNVHSKYIYDFEIDTSQTNPKDCATKIVKYLNSPDATLLAFNKNR